MSKMNLQGQCDTTRDTQVRWIPNGHKKVIVKVRLYVLKARSSLEYHVQEADEARAAPGSAAPALYTSPRNLSLGFDVVPHRTLIHDVVGLGALKSMSTRSEDCDDAR